LETITSTGAVSESRTSISGTVASAARAPTLRSTAT
jgi:hypothetical protein